MQNMRYWLSLCSSQSVERAPSLPFGRQWYVET